MSDNQKITLGVGGFLLALAILFPPVSYSTLNSYFHSLDSQTQQEMLQGCLSDKIDCSTIYDQTLAFKLIVKPDVINRIASARLLLELLLIGGCTLGAYIKFREDN